MGIRLIGGNQTGVFIANISPDSPCANTDLKIGDQILAINGRDLQNATAEQVATELNRPSESLHIKAQTDLNSKFMLSTFHNGSVNYYALVGIRSCLIFIILKINTYMYIGIDDISCGCTTNRIVNWLELEKKNKSNEYASTLSIRCGMLTPEIQLGYLFGCCMGFLNNVQIQHMYSLCFRIPYDTDSRGR